ncbi:hypothetical protein B0H17DRAFT_1340262 [Mycena rosella]|uniref:Uncharacterized protein n=1 Tax=Mycena rosella TaxID=1033263 RepID=A0AAD7FLA9_MYCRO|nr:hypothetical protein B0H17DRAFT_1340262 [Mycena rosella]
MCADAPESPKRGQPVVNCASKAKSRCREGDSQGRRIDEGGVRGESVHPAPAYPDCVHLLCITHPCSLPLYPP